MVRKQDTRYPVGAAFPIYRIIRCRLARDSIRPVESLVFHSALPCRKLPLPSLCLGRFSACEIDRVDGFFRGESELLE